MILQMPYFIPLQLSNIPPFHLRGVYIYTHTQMGPNKAFAQQKETINKTKKKTYRMGETIYK